MSTYSEKQIHIMQAAEQLFADKGFDGTSVRDIAESAGVNLAMISYYFGSKEKLMEAMFAHRSSSFRLQLENMILNKALNPLQKIEQLADQYIDKLLSQQCFHRIMVREQMVSHNSFIGTQIQQLKMRNQALIRQLIEEGQQQKLFKPQIDIPLLMNTLVGTVSQMVTTQHFYREINNLQSLTEEEFRDYIRPKLSKHIKQILKAILINDEQV